MAELGERFVILGNGDNEINISYGLKWKLNNPYTCSPGGTICFATINQSINSYPWVNFPNPPGGNCDFDKEGCFGKNSLSLLGGESSMYSQLEIYVNNTMDECINFSIFEDGNLDIELDETKIGVTVETSDEGQGQSDETVVLVLKYPLSITDQSSKRNTEIDGFFYDTQVRLRTLHVIANEIVDLDKTMENFDVVLDTQSRISDFDGDMDIEILRFGVDGTIIAPIDSTIIRINDTKFSNKGFIFQFARMNRPPALAHIDNPIINGDENLGVYFDNLLVGKIFDPDENIPTTYYYSPPPLSIGSLTLPVKTIPVHLTTCLNGKGSFNIWICVSDNDKRCMLNDVSRDWQDVSFTVSGC